MALIGYARVSTVDQDLAEAHMHARNDDGTWGITVLTFAQLGVEAPS